MRKNVFKIITIAALCFFLVVTLLVSVNIANNRQIAIEQAQKNLEIRCENAANEFRAVFDNSELIADDFIAVVERFFVVQDCYENERTLNETLEEVDGITSAMVENSRYPISMFFTLNPEYFPYTNDIWHVKNLDGSVENNGYDISMEELEKWLKQWRTHKGDYGETYWEIVDQGEVWLESYYDRDIGWEIVSIGKSLYDKNNDLIGIIGIDVYLGDIQATLDNIDKETGGKSQLIDNKGRLIAGSRIDKDDEKNLYIDSSINDYWTITLQQPVKVAIKAVQRSTITVVFLGVMLFFIVLMIMVYVYRRHGRPIIHEFEEKDILIINQARQAQLGEMVGNVAHQLKQPLNGVNMALANLKDDYSDSGEFDEKIEKIKFRISNMSETVDSFIGFLRPQKDVAAFSVSEAMDSVLDLMDERLRLESVKVSARGDDFMITGHRNEFSQCLFNIIDNARNAMLNCKDRRIEIEFDSGMISITNTGSHIEEDILDRVFDLYFTTRETEGGSGIGLYMTKSIIESHFNGTVSCHNTKEGVCFTICVPIRDREENKNEFTE